MTIYSRHCTVNYNKIGGGMELIKRMSSDFKTGILLGVYVIWLECCIREVDGSRSISAVYTFGDSILDTGNNQYIPSTFAKCNYAPYGQDFAGGTGNGRWSNGKVPSDFIVEGLGIKNTLPAYLDPSLQFQDMISGVGFASGGSGLDPKTAGRQIVPSVWSQLEMFKEYIARIKDNVGEEKGRAIIYNSMAIVSAANNDFAFTLLNPSLQTIDLDAYTSQLAQWAYDFTKGLYDVGVRRVAFFSTLPFGCLPLGRVLSLVGDCNQFANSGAQIFNTKLQGALQRLNATLPDAKLVYVDIFNAVNNLSLNPYSYGFTGILSSGCCKVLLGFSCDPLLPSSCLDPTRYIFWDDLHPTEQTYQIVMSQLWPAIQSVI